MSRIPEHFSIPRDDRFTDEEIRKYDERYRNEVRWIYFMAPYLGQSYDNYERPDDPPIAAAEHSRCSPDRRSTSNPGAKK